MGSLLGADEFRRPRCRHGKVFSHGIRGCHSEVQPVSLKNGRLGSRHRNLIAIRRGLLDLNVERPTRKGLLEGTEGWQTWAQMDGKRDEDQPAAKQLSDLTALTAWQPLRRALRHIGLDPVGDACDLRPRPRMKVVLIGDSSVLPTEFMWPAHLDLSRFKHTPWRPWPSGCC